jgi:hypothetical protein
VCAALAPADTGCKHWKPKTSVTSRANPRVPRAQQGAKEKAARDNARAAVEQFLAVKKP